jgi:SAM-dependent methyltransferase
MSREMIDGVQDRWNRLWHSAKLRWHSRGRGVEYRTYLSGQLVRSLSKKQQVPGLRSQLLVEKIDEIWNAEKTRPVLCIGSRNRYELDQFRSRAFSQVVGIDLFSEQSGILVMDMHQLRFPDDHFGIVYSCHSLEHAYDAGRVAREIIRVAQDHALVAIEVPVEYETRGADLVDVKNLDGLLALFQPCVASVLWSETQPPRSPRNDGGTPILRAIFSLKKAVEAHALPKNAVLAVNGG